MVTDKAVAKRVADVDQDQLIRLVSDELIHDILRTGPSKDGI